MRENFIIFRMKFEEFKDWINHHPMLLKVFDDTFHQDLWSIIFFMGENSKN